MAKTKAKEERKDERTTDKKEKKIEMGQDILHFAFQILRFCRESLGNCEMWLNNEKNQAQEVL